MASEILRMLAGGDRRSIGKADKAVQRVLADSSLMTEIIGGISDDDPLIRMRASDVAEKVSAAHPEYLKPFKRRLIGELARIDQQEVRWHLAQMYPRLDLTASERSRVVGILKGFLTDRSKIVQACSLEALAYFAERDDNIRPGITAIIQGMVAGGSPAVRSRGTKLLARLGEGGAG